jgi:ribose 5-phosphate isomerase B
MKIALASDHAGFRLKEEVKSYLEESNLEVIDYGTLSEESCDYPDYALKAAEAVKDGTCQLGILICGTGLGMAISANKVPGVRAIVCSDTFSARMGREHNDANVLCIGARVVGGGLVMEIVKAFLDAKFQGDRHARRVAKISAIEVKYKA